MSSEPGGIGLFSDISLFSFCLLDTGVLIFILIYFIITLSDLECDYLNAQECCGKLNFVSIIELSTTPMIRDTNSKIKIFQKRSKIALMLLIFVSVERSKAMVAALYTISLTYMRTMAVIPHQPSYMRFPYKKVSHNH